MLPLQIVAEPLIDATGNGFTVTVALPDPALEHVVASETDVKRYVVVDEGLAIKIYGLDVMPFTVTGVVPSVRVIAQGWLPVRAILREALLLKQMVGEPLRIAEGKG